MQLNEQLENDRLIELVSWSRPWKYRPINRQWPGGSKNRNPL